MMVLLLALLLQAPAPQGPPLPQATEGDFVIKDFRFASGETLPELRMHYRTLGTPRKDAQGIVRNAVLIMHGTGGTGGQFTGRGFAGELFLPGQPLDIDQVLHRDARRHRARQVEQAERRAAREVPALRLPGHADGGARAADAGARRQPPAPGDGHVDGRHAHLAMGRAVAGVHGRADAARQRAGDRSPAATASGAAW